MGQTTDPAFDAASEAPGPGETPASQGAAPAQTPNGEAAPATLTLEQVHDLLDQQARRFQSTLDKREARLVRQIAGDPRQRALRAASAAGVDIPDAKRDAFLKSLEESGVLPVEPTEPEGGEAASSGSPSDLNPVTYQGELIAEAFELTGDDPEVKLIKTGPGVTPQQYLESIRQAGRAKLKRVNGQGNPAAMPGLTPGGPPAKTNPIAHISSAEELYRQEWEDVLKRRRT